MGDLSNARLLESWELSLHAKSAGTRRLYLDVVGYFAAWLVEHDRPADNPGHLLTITRQDAEAWFTAQRSAGLSPSTLRSRWIALRNLYRWAEVEGEITSNPMARVVVDRPAPPPPELLTTDEVKALLGSCKSRDFYDVRDLAIVRLMLATGLRRAEAAELRVEDVDLRNRVVYVHHGKGDKARKVAFDRDTAEAVDRYIRQRSKHRLAHRTDKLWLSHMGAVTVKGMNSLLKNRATKAGVKNLHPHRLRHAFADRAKSAGLSDEDVMTLGGWTDPTVMRRYGAARAVDRALANYEAANPMEGL